MCRSGVRFYAVDDVMPQVVGSTRSAEVSASAAFGFGCHSRRESAAQSCSDSDDCDSEAINACHVILLSVVRLFDDSTLPGSSRHAPLEYRMHPTRWWR